MQIDGAVSATKSLREKSQPLPARVQLATEIMDGRLNIVLPRKKAVILEWVFDTLAIDPGAKAEPALWALLLALWPQVSGEVQQRVYKNHRFVVNLTQALLARPATGDWIELLSQTARLLSSAVPLFALVPDFQVSQLVLAYLAAHPAAATAKGRAAYLALGDLIFEGCRNRKGLFSKRDTDADLVLLLHEPNADHKRHYLVDYFASGGNPVISARVPPPQVYSQSDNLRFIVDAVGEAQINVAARIAALVQALPDQAAFVLQTLRALHPKLVVADMLKQILKRMFEATPPRIDWGVIELCLETSPASLLDEVSQVDRVVQSADLPDQVLAHLLLRLAQQRDLFRFLQTWQPSLSVGRADRPPVVADALAQGLELLSAPQVAALLDQRPPALSVIVDCMTYRTATSPAVRKALENITRDAPPETVLTISELVPDFPYDPKPSKAETLLLLLRQVEVGTASEKVVKRVVSALSKDPVHQDSLVLRFFPSLEACLDAAQLHQVMGACLPATRQSLVSSPVALEHVKVMNAVIDVAIANTELAILQLAPKSVYSWDQRHRAVDTVIKSALEFSEAGEFVAALIDFQHLPDPKALARFVSSALPSQAALFLDLSRVLKKDAQYIKQFSASVLPWQQVLVSCDSQLNASESDILQWMENQSAEMGEPIILALALLPPSPEVSDFTAHIATQLVTTPHFNVQLFQLLAEQNNPWPVITAVFVATDHAFEAPYAKYCSQLSESDRMALVLTAVAEKQYSLLATLAKHHFFLSDGSEAADPVSGADAGGRMLRSLHKAITMAVVEAVANNEDSVEFWEFVDALFREPLPLLSQYALESVLTHVARPPIESRWDLSVLVISRVLLFKRNSFRNRFHLIVRTLTAVLQAVTTPHQAEGFTRLVDNFVNPPQPMSKQRADRHWLTSQVAKERRYVSRVAGVLLQNIVLVILAKADEIADWNAVSQALRPAAFLLVDLVHNDGLRAVSAGMDNASRAYLRSIFEDYKRFERWTSD